MIALPRAAAKGLTAQVIRASELKDNHLILYRKALTAVETQGGQWATGHEVVLSRGKLQGRDGMIYLRNEGGRVSLFVYRAGATQMSNLISEPFPVLLLTDGWRRSVDATEDNFLAWHKRTQQQIKKQR